MDKKAEETVPTNLRIPKSLKKELGIWCIEQEREMTEVIIGLVRQMLSGKIKPPAKAVKPRRRK